MKTIGLFQMVVFVLALAGQQTTIAQSDAKKVEEYDYTATTETKLIISNKFGDINVTNTTNKDIRIKVTILVEHPDKDKARELLQYISINQQKNGETIRLETVIDDKFNRQGWFNIGGSSREFEINYDVEMPSDVDTEISNKYGDVFVDELTGHTILDVKYGNLRANRIWRDDSKPLSEVFLAYSNGSVTECNWLKSSIKYSELDISNVRALVLVSKYSEIKIDEASSIVSDSKYDDFKLGTVSNLVSNSSYTDYKLERLTKKLNLDIRYSDFKAEQIPAGFDNIKINSEYSDIKLGIAGNASYQINGELQYGDIDYPREGNFTAEEDGTRFNINGTVGNNTASKALVQLNMRYGDIDLTY